jgi:hypothetical protein
MTRAVDGRSALLQRFYSLFPLVIRLICASMPPASLTSSV